MKRILSIIPARGGSRGILRKNIATVGNKPLISWTIEASLGSNYITETIVSSDDIEILDIAKSCGSKVLKRPLEISGDDAPSSSVIIHIINELTEQNIFFDYIIFLQPTSPLRNAKNIDDAFKEFFNTDSNALISVSEIDNKFLKTLKLNNQGYLEGAFNNEYPFYRRQDLPKVYLPNGAIYIIKTSIFLEGNSLLPDKTVMYEMDSQSSIDIDSYDDIEKVNKIILSGI
ncbi:MAG: acylneuraminate cytidylyltransferase family protein [Candidatus Delongbacteria bacterium]|nr:acylneuraminate cytidylyltransferase family protein [Candidatus Delongbacteria bacterium]